MQKASPVSYLLFFQLKDMYKKKKTKQNIHAASGREQSWLCSEYGLRPTEVKLLITDSTVL